MTVPDSLMRLVPALAVAVGLIFATSSWLATPTAVGVATFAGTAVSSIMDDRLTERRLAWGVALVQGAICGLAAWLMLRWLSG
jgi:hypothetical protein